MPVTISSLVDRPDFIDACAAWTYGQWGVGSTRTLESTLERFRQAASDSVMPLTFVAHVNDRPIGMASLFEDDCELRPDLRPWLAAVFVHPDHRANGVAGLLIQAVEQAARRLGEEMIYLTTTDSQNLYTSHGWQHAGIVQYPDCDLYLMQKPLT
ncbi:GNAT family N-acetyltransferase [Salinicola salarius]|jgi:GNAT superfamily N-acetyltransferase|uniref:GNAT family N-acetyltransferase n=1 Tax=Salinicola salarius TaxID=430457 RepID=UPI000B3F93E3|nr:GNAT family N-acetyltransferase [Salinicola salarius]